jgi:hypothetical protein
LEKLPPEVRTIPLSPLETGLSPEEIKILEDNGVLTPDNDLYYMPEIFRTGLSFTLKSGARPRVLALAARMARGG